jgi:hypothetical protein
MPGAATAQRALMADGTIRAVLGTEVERPLLLLARSDSGGD